MFGDDGRLRSTVLFCITWSRLYDSTGMFVSFSTGKWVSFLMAAWDWKRSMILY